jgi:secondary thiamine-phosphate synthase enzyme
MEVVTEHIQVATHGNSEVIDITGQVSSVLQRQNLREGAVTIFVIGSTASVTTTEFEPGLRKDIPDMLERLAPSSTHYHHDDTWGDGNGHAHVRASFLGPSLTVPFSSGKLFLGTWQQIVLIDFDNKSRYRDIVVQLIGT